MTMSRLNKKRNRSSSTSSDDEPLTKLKQDNDIYYSPLFEYRLEKCEICEEVFENRFQSLVHGANHIIIPLWNQKLYQCPECLFHYQSLAILNEHISNKHLTNERKASDTMDMSEVIVLDDDDEEVEESQCLIPEVGTPLYVTPEVIKALIEKSQIVIPSLQSPQNVPDIAKSCLVIPESEKPLFIMPHEKPMQYEVPDLIKSRIVLGAKKCEDMKEQRYNIKEPVIINSEHKIKTPAIKSCQRKDKKKKVTVEKTSQEFQPKQVNGVSSSKNCLVFEEDDEDEVFTLPNLMNDLTTECKDSVKEIKLAEVKNDMVYSYTPSIHYDDLVKPGLFRCKICLLTFPNKLQTIVHEASHVTFKKDVQYLCPVCEKYIAGGIWGLRRHKTEKHIQTSPVHAIPSNCKKCKLKFYNYYKHDLYYHKIFVCPTCSCRFEVEEQRRSHVENIHNVHKKIDERKLNELQEMSNLHVCDVCVMFVKSRANIHYKVEGEKCEVGKTQICDMCNAKCFGVKIVKRMRRPKLYHKVDKKPISNNMERLKKIQNRLSVISKMNKF